jgi:hypothetical protein
MALVEWFEFVGSDVAAQYDSTHVCHSTTTQLAQRIGATTTQLHRFYVLDISHYITNKIIVNQVVYCCQTQQQQQQRRGWQHRAPMCTRRAPPHTCCTRSSAIRCPMPRW